MTTIQAGALRAALEKAKSVGLVEEEVTIDGCQLVLQSLKPEAYVDIDTETGDLEGLAYFNAFVAAHVSRSICEIDGQDLRDVQFIEDEAPPGAIVWGVFPNKEMAQQVAQEIEKAGGETRVVPADAPAEQRMVRYERHDWVYQNIMANWSREAMNVGWRKFAEVLQAAELKAKEGIDFRIPDETQEDRYRRLLNELLETGEELPIELTGRILKDSGLMTVTSVEELTSATSRIDQLAAQEPSVARPTPQPVPVAQPAPAASQAAPEPGPEPPSPSQVAEQLHARMQNRQPLNQQASGPAPPRPQSTMNVPAQRMKAKVPDQIRKAAMANTASVSKRASMIAQLEGAVDPDLEVPEGGGQLPIVAPEDIPILEARQKPVEGTQVAAITEQPPAIGINPRFKPPGR